MGLVERLEELAKKLDAQRWNKGSYVVEIVERSDMIAEAAKRLRELEAKCPN